MPDEFAQGPAYTYHGGEGSGFGKLAYGSGAVYEGEWVDNQMQGSGKYTYPDGGSYEGEFVKSLSLIHI